MDDIPSVSFKEGSVVVTENDEYVEHTIDGEATDINTLFESLSDYERIYLIDLDGIERNRPQLDLIKRLSIRREVWVDCGVRDMNTLLDLYVAGADRVVISTKTLRDMDFVEKAVEISDSMVFSIDIFHGKILSPSDEIGNMSLIQVLKKVVDMGIKTVIISNLDDSTLDLLELRNAPQEDYQIFTAGDVRNDSDIEGRIIGLKEVLRSQMKN